jgi:hypothetical protein
VHTGLSPLNRFGYNTPNEWNTFVLHHTIAEAIALSNKMKELNKNNKLRHKLGPWGGGYKATIPIWTMKEQELHEAGILDPFEGCTMHTKNRIRGCSCIDENKQLVTSSSEVTSMIEKAKTLVAKEKTGEF